MWAASCRQVLWRPKVAHSALQGRKQSINLVTKKKGWPRQHPSNPSGRPGPMDWKRYHTLCEVTYANLSQSACAGRRRAGETASHCTMHPATDSFEQHRRNCLLGPTQKKKDSQSSQSDSSNTYRQPSKDGRLSRVGQGRKVWET